MLFFSSSDVTIKMQDILRVQAEEFARLNRFRNRHMILSGDYKELVKGEVRRIFKNEANARKVQTLYDVSSNVAKQIIEEIYRFPGAVRKYRLPNGEIDQTYETLTTKIINMQLIMQEVVTALGGLNDCLIHILPGAMSSDGAISAPVMRVLRPHECSVIPYEDDLSRPAVVTYERLTSGGKKQIVVWTPTEHYIINEKNKQIPAPGGDGKNPFGFVPFVAAHNGGRVDRFWDENTRQALYDFTLQYAAHWSALNHVRHYNSFATLVRTGYRAGDNAKDIETLDPAQMLDAPDGGDYKVLSMVVDLTGFVNSLKAQLGQRVAEDGLMVDDLFGNPGQAPPSAISRYIKRQTIIERRDRLKPYIEEAEYEIADMLRYMWNFSNVSKISEEADFEITFNDDQLKLSPIEEEELKIKRLERMKKELDMGLVTLNDMRDELNIPRVMSEKPSQDVDIFAYDQDNAVATMNEIRAAKGMPPHPDPSIGNKTIPEIKNMQKYSQEPKE